jgi:hypothetical protein
MRRLLLVVTLAGGLLLFLPASVSAAEPRYVCESDDCNPYAEGYGSEAAHEDWWPNGQCRTVGRYRKRTTWWGHVVYKYHQRVQWCWSGGVVTHVWRTRYPDIGCCFWQFFGNVGNNCASENCAEQTGRSFADLITVGQFRYCNAWCALEKNPGLHFQVYAGGGYNYATWG